MGGKKSGWSSVPQFFSKAIRSLMATPLPPSIPALFTPLHSNTPSWCNTSAWLQQLSHYHDSRECFVERVAHCKCTDGKEHEFLLFRISHLPNKCKATVIAERTVSLSGDGSTNTTKNHTAALSNGSHSCAPSFRSLPANDIVHFATSDTSSAVKLESDFGKYRELRVLTYSTTTSPSAIDLATLLQTTSNVAASYLMYEHQCYWFAHTAFEALYSLFPTERTGNEKKVGTYSRVPIPKADSVDAVVTAYREEKAAVAAREEEKKREREEREEARRAKDKAAGQAEERAKHEAEMRERDERERQLRAQAEEFRAQAEEFRAQAEAREEELRAREDRHVRELNELRARLAPGGGN
ncbi:hypothetical protein PAXINDRAFT_171442 [Paxillus involutus ATCC 200175]|uniref:Uncharacterized protein n=1 Tax=Paxillus involutus ATCC 200175 TaxID=664439 RepID=A0A0C9TXL6_PAXIN|nr:hypothetical protein PAXINDRAFT_171442 [Paxillus involutus ATCC 200175]